MIFLLSNCHLIVFSWTDIIEFMNIFQSLKDKKKHRTSYTLIGLKSCRWFQKEKMFNAWKMLLLFLWQDWNSKHKMLCVKAYVKIHGLFWDSALFTNCVYNFKEYSWKLLLPPHEKGLLQTKTVPSWGKQFSGHCNALVSTEQRQATWELSLGDQTQLGSRAGHGAGCSWGQEHVRSQKPPPWQLSAAKAALQKNTSWSLLETAQVKNRWQAGNCSPVQISLLSPTSRLTCMASSNICRRMI